jgi:hypothetical protein
VIAQLTDRVHAIEEILGRLMEALGGLVQLDNEQAC